MSTQLRQGFWREVFARQGSIIPRVLSLVLTFGVVAAVIWVLARLIEQSLSVWCALEIMPFEFAGVALGVLLVFRTNAGYDRWWEARTLWGRIVNFSRCVARQAVTFIPVGDEPQDHDLLALFDWLEQQRALQRPVALAGGELRQYFRRPARVSVR